MSVAEVGGADLLLAGGAGAGAGVGLLGDGTETVQAGGRAGKGGVGLALEGPEGRPLGEYGLEGRLLRGEDERKGKRI